VRGKRGGGGEGDRRRAAGERKRRISSCASAGGKEKNKRGRGKSATGLAETAARKGKTVFYLEALASVTKEKEKGPPSLSFLLPRGGKRGGERRHAGLMHAAREERKRREIFLRIGGNRGGKGRRGKGGALFDFQKGKKKKEEGRPWKPDRLRGKKRKNNRRSLPTPGAKKDGCSLEKKKKEIRNSF